MEAERLMMQIDFIREIDKLKHVYRQTLLMNGSRHENDAEHSWHLAVMAMLLKEHADKEIDVLKVMKMVLIHDLVEIDAGDTFCYDDEAKIDKEQRERKAADRIFHILPEDQAWELTNLWEEFEERSTPEACFAATLDRIQPLLHNYYTKGHSWKKHGVSSDKVLERTRPIKECSEALWNLAQEIIRQSVEKGYLFP